MRSVVEDPRDVDSIDLTDAVIVTGWFPHDDGKPLWFAQCRWKTGLCSATQYGDTRDEAFHRILQNAESDRH
jgi:hypothetical protein